MFTGIVEDCGKVLTINDNNQIRTVVFQANNDFSDTKLGDSIAVNGVCLTVTQFRNKQITVECVPETLRCTNLGELKESDFVNLERALLPTTRMGGHFVQGHTDTTAEIVNIEKEGEAWMVTFSLPDTVKPYIVKKGFITIDGMSLTIVSVDKNRFKITFIPHTQKNTIVKNYQVGQSVNIEADILAKYIQEQYRCKQD